MIKKIMSFRLFKARKVSSASAIKSGYSHGRYDANSNALSAYYKD